MEIYDCFLNWLANYAIVISTSISLFLTILTCLFNIKSEIQWKIVFYTTILTIILSVPYYIVPFYFPYVLLPFFGILFAIYLNNKKNKSNIKVYSTIIYLINSLTYAIAIELAKVPFNTWGSGTIYVGVYLIALCLPLFHLLKFSYNQDSLYGYIKLTTGLILLLIILITIELNQ